MTRGEEGDLWPAGLPYQREEIIKAGDLDATSSVEDTGEALPRIRDTAFRSAASAGFRWSLPAEPLPRLSYLATWGCFIEFLYVGHFQVEEISDEQALEEWRQQRARIAHTRY